MFFITKRPISTILSTHFRLWRGCFAIPVDSEVTLSIYNMQGRLVSTLIESKIEAGYHTLQWNADSYSSGIYFVKMVAGGFVNTQKLMLVK